MVGSGRNLAALRGHNSALVLDVIRRDPGISQAEVAELVKLTRQAVSKIVARLMALGLVEVTGRLISGVGKPREQLAVVRSAKYAIGVGMDRTSWRVVLADLVGDPVASIAGTHDQVPAPEILVDRVAQAADRVVLDTGVQRDRVLGVGVGVVGPLDHRRGIVTGANNFGGWRDVPLAQLMADRTGFPCTVDKDAAVATIAEYWHAADPEQSGIVVLLGSGIGSGLVVDGAVYRGARTDAGEFGHMRFDPDGARCVCGRRGCVETVASEAAVVARHASAVAGEPLRPDQVIGWTPTTADRFHGIAQRAAQGHVLSAEIVRRAGEMLGIAIASVVELLDVESVVLTGQMVAHAGETYVRGVREALARDAQYSPRPPAVLRVSTLGSGVVELGAALLVLGSFGADESASRGTPYLRPREFPLGLRNGPSVTD